MDGDLQERLAATERLYGDLGLELGTTGAAFASGWEPLQGECSALEINDGALSKKNRPPQC